MFWILTIACMCYLEFGDPGRDRSYVPDVPYIQCYFSGFLAAYHCRHRPSGADHPPSSLPCSVVLGAKRGSDPDQVHSCLSLEDV
jgi:hypothetical protein